MDKNKSRTDLLSAGRKKLQQYRQKKDKGSGSGQGKSAKKSAKSEQPREAVAVDDAVSSGATEPAVSSEIRDDGGAESAVGSDSGFVDASSNAVENSAGSEAGIDDVGPAEVPVPWEDSAVETEAEKTAELPSDEVGVSEPGTADAEVAPGDVFLESSQTLDSGEAKDLGVSAQVDESAQHASVDITEGVSVSGGSDIPSSVADVGPSAEPVTHEKIVLETELEKYAEAPSEEAEVSKPDADSSVLNEGESTVTVDAEVARDVSVDSGKEAENLNMPPQVDESAQQASDRIVDGESVIVESESTADIGPSEVPITQGKSVVEIKLEGNTNSLPLDEAETTKTHTDFSVQNEGQSTGPADGETSNTVDSGGEAESKNMSIQVDESVQNAFVDITDRTSKSAESDVSISVKESFPSGENINMSSVQDREDQVTDMEHQFERQPQFDHEHHRLLEETSYLRASLNELTEKNQSLAEELSQCRGEPQAVAYEKEEIGNKYHAAKLEIEEASSRAIDFHNSLERAQQDIVRLSTELADCKDLVRALEGETVTLHETIASADESKSKLIEQNNIYILEKEKLSADLVDCEALVATLQGQISNLDGNLDSVTQERENLSFESEKLATELHDSKNIVSALQVEIASLNESLALIMEEKKKLAEERDYSAHENERISAELVALEERLSAEVEKQARYEVDQKETTKQLEYSAHENERISSELVALEERLSAEREKQVRYEVDLKETTKHLEQLTNENISFPSSQEILKAQMSEVENSGIKVPVPAGESGKQVELSRGLDFETEDHTSLQIPVKQDTETPFVVDKPLSDACVRDSSFSNTGLEILSDADGFVALNHHLNKADKMLHNLVHEIEHICARFTSQNKSGNEARIPQVSKIIQAFELKAHNPDEHVEGLGLVLTDHRSPGDSVVFVREQIENLKALLRQSLLDAANTSLLLKEERDGRKNADAISSELKDQNEALEEYSQKIEATNIELKVLYEALEDHRRSLDSKNSELLILCEYLQKEVINIKAESVEVDRKLHVYESRTSQLHGQLQDLHLTSNVMASQISEQLEIFHREVAEKVMLLESHWNSTIDPILEAAGKLDKSLGRASTTTTVSHGSLDKISHTVASIHDAISFIKDLKDKLESSHTEHESLSTLYKEVNEKCDDLHGKNEMATKLLQKLFDNLSKLFMVLHDSTDGSDMFLDTEKLSDPLDYSSFVAIIEHIESSLRGSLQLESVNKKLSSELMARNEELEEVKQRCLDCTALQKLIGDVEGVLKVEHTEFQWDKTPASHLESLVSRLVQKCEVANVQAGLSKEDFGSKVVELSSMQEEVQQLNALCLQHESELVVLRESLHHAEEALIVARSEIEGKINELEQSEQRVSSLREKLTIAVTKGKGLIVQRDALKQSLNEKSVELERFSQELQMKDARLLEIETRLQSNSESGERVEALESELSYIRNSATALRESFLLKDSVLQRIEEILEDLDLPEHFHSRNIIEKVDWLARTATSNTFPVTDSDQKSSAGGGSYSDDVQPVSDSTEDTKRKYDELQHKFYGLAEQNEMLEQSLMERNNIVQRWEELLDRIDMPSHLRSVEPEDRIDWLRKALSEVQEDNMSLQQKVFNLEDSCVSLTADLEDSQRRVAELEADFQSIIHERDHLSGRLEAVVKDQEKLSANEAEYELENEQLEKEVTDLQDTVAKMHGNENKILNMESDLRRLQNLVTGALGMSGSEYEYSGGSSIESFEGLLNKLLEIYTTLSMEKPVHGGATGSLHTEDADAKVVESRSLNFHESNIDVLKKELEEVQGELLDVKEERDGYLKKQQTMTSEFESLHNKVHELQVLLNQEEQKSASVREKLNIAVRKGKSLMQQRDSLKQTIEEVSSEVEHLRSEIKTGQVKIVEYERRFTELSTYPGRVEALESEILFLRNCLNETEQNMQQKANTLNMILDIIDNIDVGGDFNSIDPVVKLEQIGKIFFDLRKDVASSEQEARKSKRAAELLLAELNEVQERNDSLQEELSKSVDEISILSKERDLAEAGKLEAVVNLEKLSTAHTRERKDQFSEFAGLKSDVDQLRKGFLDMSNSLAGLFHNDLEFLNNLESGIQSCLHLNKANVVDVHPFSAAGGFLESKSDKDNSISTNYGSDPSLPGKYGDNFVIETFTYIAHYVQELMMEIGGVKEKIDEHSVSLHEKTSSISRVVTTVREEITSRIESFEDLRRDFLQMEMVKKENDKELIVLRRNATLLFEACSSSVVEINRRKAELVENSWDIRDLKMISKITELPAFNGQSQLYSEESIRSMADMIYSAASDFATLTTELVEGGQKKMKFTISNLQTELREKEVQKERILTELVGQIKEAEATASSYSLDLESSKSLVHDLEKQLEVMRGERNSFEQRAKELEHGQATSDELQQRVRSLTDVLAAKDHEIEELMQALDEEETQMQGVTSKITELEKIVEQKNLDLENLQASRAKVMKKLSVTVNKFDELHHLSASLLAEVEKLQSQLQDRDAEISFLRQEVTRCTNDVLVASQVSNKGDSDEIHELLTWFNMNIARYGLWNEYLEDKKSSDVPEQKEVLKKIVDCILSELGDLRSTAQIKDKLLQEERTKVEELTRKGQTLEKSLRDKDSRLNLLERVENGQATSSSSEIHEPEINKWVASGSSAASQVCSLRKGNSEQVAIAIDMDPQSSNRMEDEDDDKVHGFKSLTTSRVIPRFTRPVTDMVDGLWVTCDRALMRQPILRLGIIFYWAFLHTLLASLAI